MCKKQQNVTKKNFLHSLENSHHLQRDRPRMFKATQRFCMKYIQEYDPLQYKEVTNAELDFLGFQLHVTTKPDVRTNKDITTNVTDNVMTNINDNVTTNGNDNVMTNVNDSITTNANDNVITNVDDSITTNANDNVTTPIDDEIFEFHSPSPISTSPLHESFCDVWFRSDSPHFSSVSRPIIYKIDKKGNVIVKC